MERRSRTTLVLATAAGVLTLSACNLGPTAASGTITELDHRDSWIETDCSFEAGADEPTCTASVEQDCYLVRFEDDTYEYSDCVGKREWDGLKVGDEYTDREDQD